MSTGHDRRDRAHGSATMAHVAFGALLVAVLAVRVLAVFTENVNWDEFALLHRAAVSLQTGQLAGGGRPGLGTLLLTPFATACSNAIDALVQARLLWTAMVAGSAVTFWFLLRSVVPPSPHRWAAVATGLGLWVLAPAVLRYSIQVRTDQPAILFGLLGGLALVASRRHIFLAPLAGALFAIGFLFSQKLLYVAGLVGVLTIGQLLILGEWRTRRELWRVTLAAASFLLIVLGFRVVMSTIGTAPALLPVSGALNVFEYYRETYGWRLYRAMMPSLLPQFVAVACLLAVTSAWSRKPGRHVGEVVTAWLVLLVGIAVLFIHAARFPYFYMVLGLFPATVAALVLGPSLERIGTRTGQRLLLSVIWIPLTVFGLQQALRTTIDTQRLQRESLAFVDRNFAPDARGFHGQGAFVCRSDPDHFPVRFNQNVIAEFDGEDGSERTRELIDEFRTRPVVFLIMPYDLYPRELWEFWRTRYVLYHGAVHVPGRRLRGEPGTSGTFEVIVPGEYVWRPSSPDSGPLHVAGLLVDAGSSVVIREPGVYAVGLPAGGEGMFVLALPDPPAPDHTPFYRGW
jgi:hypothetical protein